MTALVAGGLVLAATFLVLGTIFLGIATPTEGGAMGALGAIVMAIARGRLSFSLLKQALNTTTKLSCFVVFILIGATIFGLTFQGVDGPRWVEHLLSGLPGGQLGFLIVVNILIFVLAFFLDFFELSFIVVPLLAPVADKLGIDLVWFGVLLAVNMQTSFMHPPFGFALFYLRSVAPDKEYTDKFGKNPTAKLGTAETKELEERLCTRFEWGLITDIQQSRLALYQTIIHETNCQWLLECLENYKYEFNSKLQMWTEKPLHDKHSNMMDALRYAVQATKELDFFGNRSGDEPETDPPADALPDGPYQPDPRETSLVSASRTFTIGMPRVAGSATTAAAAAAVETPASERKRVLLVEDNEDAAMALALCLEEYGYVVHHAGTCADALAAANAHTFDAVLTDLGLPDGSGIEIGRALSDALPVLALSGYGREQDRLRCAEAGFVAHLVKPADPALVHAKLTEVLASQTAA